MAKKSAYDKNALQQILSDETCRTINDDGRILPPSHKVYQTISDMMANKGSPITPKHIHTIVNNNRSGFRDLVMAVFDIKQHNISTISPRISVNVDNYSVEGCVDQSSSLTSIKINLVISQEKWKSIKPQEKMYGKRIYWKLRQGWADVIAEALWVQHHLDCVFVFKNHNIYRSAIAKFYLKIEGYCRECDAKIYSTLIKEPPNNVDVILQCNVDGIRAACHTGKKRRQLRGVRRINVADYLIEGRKDAVSWRRREAGRIKKFGGKDPPILPSNEVVRKAKQQQLLSKYGLEFGNPALNLLKSAEHGKLLGSIKFIGLYKFNCIYWLPEQLQIYVSRCRNDPNALLAIDATGGIAKRDKSQKSHILLYQCVLKTKDGSIPVFQMVSADQRSIIVAGFLSHILAAGAPIPPIVVTDFGWSLLIAVAQIFGQCSNLNDYLQKCYNAVLNRSTYLPSTFMRLDVCHLMSMITRWPSFRGKDKTLVRRFYKRCIGKACQISNLEDLSYFLESVLIVALSKCIGHGPNKNILISNVRLRFLNNMIKGMEKEYDDNEADESCEEIGIKSDDESIFNTDQEYKIGMDNPGWKSWVEELYSIAIDSADHSCEGDTINACYSIDFAKRLKRNLLPYLPLWTSIMVPIFGRGSVTATSAAVESEFSDMKNRDFKGEIPMRIDRFIVQHLERIDYKIRERTKTIDNIYTADDHNKLKNIENLPSGMEGHHDMANTKHEIIPSRQSIENITKNTITSESSDEEVELFLDENMPSKNEWNIKEEWGGLNKNAKRIEDEITSFKKKPTCLDKCPEWDFIKDAKTAHAPVLVNGNLMGPVRIRNQYLNIKSTCSFDSIFQAILNGIIVNKAYSEKLLSSNCPIVNLAQSVRDKKKILREHYLQRAKILTDISMFQSMVTNYTKKIKSVNVECNVAHLSQFLLKQEPSYVCRVDCSCGYMKLHEYTFISVNMNIILWHGLNRMQEAINDCINEKRSCHSCKNKIKCSNDYGPHLIIDTTVITDPCYIYPNKENIAGFRLNCLKKIVEVGGKTYILTAVVDFNVEQKHYTTYALTGEFWYKYDDLIKKCQSASSKICITPHLIIYTICNGNVV